MIRRLLRSIRNNIVIGLVLVTPVVLTVFIINWIFQFTTNRLLPESLRTADNELLYRAAALLAGLTLLFLIGLFVRNIIGKKLYHLGDTILTKIPIINKVYIYVRQISESILAQRQALFKEVVALEYPRKGLHSIAFVTASLPPEFKEQLKPNTEDEWLSLFIPTTPNPTSGILILLPRSETIPMDISVANAMKLVISGGVAYPGNEPPGTRPSLLDKLDVMMKVDSARDIKKHVAENDDAGT